MSPRQGQLNPCTELEGDHVYWELFSHELAKEERQKNLSNNAVSMYAQGSLNLFK